MSHDTIYLDDYEIFIDLNNGFNEPYLYISVNGTHVADIYLPQGDKK